MPISGEQLALWKRLADAASPPPWRFVADAQTGIASPLQRDLPDICVTDGGYYGPSEADAKSIMAAREAVPALIAEVERLRVLVGDRA